MQPPRRALQHLLSRSRREATEVHDDLHTYVAEHLGADDGMPIIDDTGCARRDSSAVTIMKHPHRDR
ncbi:hypothetical protein OG209_32510 [Streptomyces sp. NBC_01383]|uniref:hypothetical protein n=1 Tax=Streptomyces sp. NBC_01383 TaxID=2903846 RepID=UPI00324BCF0C